MVRVVRNSGGNSSPAKSNLLTMAIPVVAAIAVLILIIKAIFSSSSDTNTAQGANFVTITPKAQNSEIYIYMSGDTKKAITGAEKMYPTDNRAEIKTGDADITIEGSQTKLSADRLAEFSYRGLQDAKHAFELQSSYIWVESPAADTVFKLKNFTVTPSAGAVFALSQNAVGSNAYVLKGNITVATENSSTTVSLNQMITVLAAEAKTAKLPDEILPIDSFFKTTDIYTNHNGDSYLSSGLSTASGSLTDSGSTASGSTSSSKPLSFTYPEDEATIDTATIDIEGKIFSSQIEKITINEKEVQLNKEAKTFSYKGFPLNNEETDLVYRAFDKDGLVVPNGKGVITVHSTTKKDTSATKPTVTTFPVSDKDFPIVSPTSNPFKTSDDVIKIEGRLTKGVVKYITVNGFRLSKFAQGSTSWYYFANKDFGTMNIGINSYEIKYYGMNDELLNTSSFIIVKENKADEEVETPVKPVTTTATGTTSGTGKTTSKSL